MNKDVEFLNNTLNKIGAKGFLFKRHNVAIVLSIPNRADKLDYGSYSSFGYWKSINDMFIEKNVTVISHILSCREKIINDANNKINCFCDYCAINAAGADFLKCLLKSSSLEELELKLSILGY